MIKILAIDDNKDNLVVLTTLLSAAFPNARVITSQSGKEGIDKARVERPDVILLDLVMPVMDGYETCKILKEDDELQRIPVIILTAMHTDSVSRIRALKLGAESFLAKPIDEAELTAQVSSMLRIKSSEDKVIQENQRLEALVNERTKGLEESKRAALNLLDGLKAEIELRRVSDEALRQSEEQFRNLYTEAPVGLYRTTPDGKILLANRAIFEMLGFSNFEELSSRNLEEVGFEPSYRRQQFIEQIEKNGEVKELEAKWICCNGEVIMVRESAKVICDANGKPIYYDGTVEDITKRDHIEKDLQQSEERFRNVTQSANDAIITINSKGIVSGWNRGAEKIFGYTENEIKGKELSVIIPQKYRELHVKSLERIKQGGDYHVIGKTVELYGLHKSGNEFPIELSLSEWETGSGKSFSGIIRDITDRKHADAVLKEALEKAESGNRLKTAFMNNISHEVRTPLNGILGFSNLLTQPDITLEEKVQYYSLIKTSSNRLLDTITSYMDISMIASGNMEVKRKPFDLHKILNQLYDQFQPLCAVKNLGLHLKTPAKTKGITLHADAELFQKILTNLLDNAAKFTHQGMIIFGYEIQSTVTTGLTAEESGNPVALEFYIKDTGIGISRESLSMIFDSFKQEELCPTRGHEGSGLGLTIAQGLVQLLGGKIRVESAKDKGSTFFFTIPTEGMKEEVEMPEAIRTEGAVLGSPVVLVAEDDMSNVQFIEAVLRKTAVTLLVANNGKEAVDLCRVHPEISLVLMDLKMPVMDGLEATREIKSFRKNLPIIALTAFALSGDEKKAQEAGCDDYTSKPVSRKELLEKLQQYGIPL